MYQRFIEKREKRRAEGWMEVLRENPAFTASGVILIFLIVLAFYGGLVPKAEYTNRSDFREEYRNPPTLRSYILVKKRTAQLQLSPRQNPNPKTSQNWQPKPTSYDLQPDEVVFTGPTGERKIFKNHLFGTDLEGRDLFLRTLVSIKVYLFPSLMAIGLSVFLGTLLGIFGAGIWTGLWAVVQFFAQCLMDGLEALPKYITLLLAIVLIPVDLRHFQWHGINWYGFYWLSLVLGLLAAPKLGKLVMERIDFLKKREFIEAAEATGMSMFTVALKHVLWYNCLPLFLTQAAALVTDVVLTEIVLSYLVDGTDWGRGITVAEPLPSWGNILVTGRYYLFSAWWVNFFPLFTALTWGSAIYMFVEGLNKISTRRRASTEL
jgi:peptide/nickel transport system permease protein